MKRSFLITFFILLAGLVTAQAQSTVTFKVNLKPNLADSAFIPGQDIIQVTGNIFPLSSQPVQLSDSTPADSIYTAQVNFSGTYVGDQLEYNFVIIKPNERETERMARKLNLRSGEMELPALFFNAFAW